MSVTANEILADMARGIRTYGTYAFDDKGPREVMNITPYASRLRLMEPKEAADVIVTVAESHICEERGAVVAEHLTIELQDWEELFAADPAIDRIYSGEDDGGGSIEVAALTLSQVLEALK
jgi:hypothetical protein